MSCQARARHRASGVGWWPGPAPPRRGDDCPGRPRRRAMMMCEPFEYRIARRDCDLIEFQVVDLLPVFGPRRAGPPAGGAAEMGLVRDRLYSVAP